MSSYKWTCPDCGGTVIEEVLQDVTQSSSIEALAYDKESDTIIADYGAVSHTGGDVDSIYYCCQECGKEITIDEMYKIAKGG